MKRVVVCLGSNRDANFVERAIEKLNEMLIITACSSIYSTPAVGSIGQPYSNAVVFGETDYSLEDLITIFKAYEIEQGRTDLCRKYDEVIIDIDVVIYDDMVVREWDFRQNFFQIGFSELAGTVIQK